MTKVVTSPSRLKVSQDLRNVIEGRVENLRLDLEVVLGGHHIGVGLGLRVNPFTVIELELLLDRHEL